MGFVMSPEEAGNVSLLSPRDRAVVLIGDMFLVSTGRRPDGIQDVVDSIIEAASKGAAPCSCPTKKK